MTSSLWRGVFNKHAFLQADATVQTKVPAVSQTILIQINTPDENHILVSAESTPNFCDEATMTEAASYRTYERLGNGTRIEIRALHQDDKKNMLMAFKRASMHSLQRRFFSARRSFSEQEIDYFVNVDFSNHVALVACVTEDDEPSIVGGGRYIVTNATAEFAVMVVDEWQGQGVGSMLLRHLLKIACNANLQEATAEVLAENIAMLRVFSKLGFKREMQRDPQTVHLTLSLNRNRN